MIQKLRFLLFAVCISVAGYAQVANSPGVVGVCDDVFDDGIRETDLTFLNLEILGGQSEVDFSVTYHLTLADADSGVAPLIMPFTNTSNPQTIFIRVTENSSGNFDTTSMILDVLPRPIANSPTPLTLCDDDGDGFASFDLSSKIDEISNGEPNTILTVHETLVSAEIGVDALDFIYTNSTPNAQTVYWRIENATSGCFTVIELQLIVDNPPSAGFDGVVDLCDDDNSFDLFNSLGGNPDTGGEWSPLLSSGTGNFDPAIDSPGIYTYTVLGTGVCNGTNATATITVTINETPEPMLEDVVMCEVSSIVVDTGLNNPNFSYSWSLDGIEIPGENMSTLLINQPGVYEVMVNNIGCIANVFFNVTQIACDDVDDDTVIDVIEDLNNDGNLANDDTDEDGIPNYLDDDDDGDGILTIDEDYNGNGDPTDDDTNMNDIPDYLDADVALGLNDLTLTNFKLYPNPAKNSLTIELSNAIQQLSFSIYNLEGQRVLTSNLSSETLQQIDISSLKSGLYFVTLSSGKVKTTKKLVVQ